MGGRPVFILGLGAEKSATTWLSSELWRHPQIGFAPGELHVWSTRYLGLDPDTHHHSPARRTPHLLANIERSAPGGIERALREAELAELATYDALRRDPAGYAPCFQTLLAANPARRAVGEKSPAYALLDRHHYLEIRGVLEDAGFAVRPVYVMRDPVERVLSRYRYELWFRATTRPDRTLPTLAAFAAKPRIARLTRYDLTLADAEAAFGEACFVGFDEEVTRPGGLDPLYRHVGVDPLPADTTQRVFATLGRYDATADERLALREQFAPVYDAVVARFGRVRVGRAWPSLELTRGSLAR
jgi:hypothetical protein